MRSRPHFLQRGIRYPVNAEFALLVRLFAILLAGMLTGCGRFEGAFRFLREPPTKDAVPGVFVLDRSSYSDSMLRAMGYADLSVRVDLNADGTFGIARMPDCWLTDLGDPKGGYDSCCGTWSIDQSQAVYAVSLSIDWWSDDSTYSKERQSSGLSYTAVFTLTKENEDTA
ncbi:MAG TPA: hypothetical protein VIT91_02665 [Chthoniobacterales bacterium]